MDDHKPRAPLAFAVFPSSSAGCRAAPRGVGRRVTRAGVVAGLVAVLVACQPDPPQPPNVILYLVDTLRADSVDTGAAEAAHPAVFTPNVARLAREAVVFGSARAPSSWTRASISSIFTGTLPSVHATEARIDHLPESVTTLAERLSDEGFATAFVTTNPNTAAYFGLGQGFDDIIEMYRNTWILELADAYEHPEDGSEPVVAAVSEADSMLATRKTIEWLEQAPRPFFLVVLTVDPHQPYEPRPEDLKRTRDAWERSLSESADSARVDSRRLRYWAEIAFNDASFGVLLDHLRRRDELDRSIVFFSSDHGEEFFEHGNEGHGRSLYDEVLRVPLILRYPGDPRVRAGNRIARPVSTVDIAPTVLDLLGLAPMPGTSGRSLLLEDDDSEPLYARLAMDGHRLDSIVDPPWKLIVDRKSGTHALYDLRADPGEQTRLESSGDPRAARALARLLEEWQRRSRPDGRAEIERTTHDEDLPEKLRRPLEALGYIE